MKHHVIASLTLLTFSIPAFSQSTRPPPPWALSGYVEGYYLKAWHGSRDAVLPAFLYNFNQPNEAKINLALLRATYSADRLRANVGLADGSYMKANYAAEPSGLNKAFEANIGFKLSSQHALWLDVGVFPSHIGFESAIGKDSATLTRSLAAENSPYFETGAKLTYSSPDGKWQLSGLLLNGWQRIQRPDGNTTPALGHQIIYKPTARLTLNSSSFVGNDKSDAERRMRYFHDLYAQFQLNGIWSFAAGMDIGAEQNARGSKDYSVWYTPVAVARVQVLEQIAIAARLEHYRDKQGVIVASNAPDGFRMTGYSLNVDYQLLPNLLWRSEVKRFSGSEGTFATADGSHSSDSTMAVTSLAISF